MQNNLDLSILDTMEEQEAYDYIRSKFGESTLKEVKKRVEDLLKEEEKENAKKV